MTSPEISAPDKNSRFEQTVRAVLFLLVLCATLFLVFTPGFVTEVFTSLVRQETGGGGLLHPVIIATAALIYLWERYWPVGGRKISAPAQLTDLGWWLINATCAVSFPVVFAAMASQASGSVPAVEEKFDVLGGLPWWLRYALAILLVDFVRFAIHVLRHQIPLLWRFHATHHSTHDLNQFSAFRMHPVDYAFSAAVAAIPFSLFSVPVEGFVIYQVVSGVLGRTHHAAVKWKWPIVNWILVSPQVHRIHHSTSDKCYGKNYGLTFSIWDRIFGTYMEPESEDPTPTTGVPGFKNVEATTIAEVPIVLVKQLLAPLRKFDSEE